jgi:oxygen-dependent protoporphyrinogen oxidase
MSRHVLIVGGGITGLALAHRLSMLARNGGASARTITLVEARAAVGGNIRTERRDGFVIEGGPDSFVAAKPEATALCRELGLGDRLIGTTKENRQAFVAKKGRLHPLPEGVVLTIPTRVLPLVKTPLLSWRGKLRMALDLAVPRGAVDDESLGAFIRRRLGDEALTELAEPLLGGIYAGDVDRLSVRSTFPQLVGYEERHRSLIRGALAMRRAAAARASGKEAPSAFATLRGGMSELVTALERRLRDAGVQLRLGTRVASVAREGARFMARLEGDSGELGSIAADEVVFTSPAYASASALRSLDAELAQALDQTPYVSTGTISLAFERDAIAHPLNGVGIILSKREKRRILAATFSSSKWAERAPSGHALLRVFVGGHHQPDALSQTDEALIALAQDELGSLLQIRSAPLFARVFRYERSNPQPVVGHAARLASVRDRAPEGLHFAGAAFDGVGIPDCIRQANEVAERLA